MTLREIEARFRGRAPGVQDITGESAVLVPLIPGEDGPELLFEVRASGLRNQPGEVCFPGGRMEPGERPEETALRETWEELAIPPERVRVLAHLDGLLHQSGFLLHPILGEVEPEAAASLRPSPAEVGETFRVPLRWFLDHPPRVERYALRPEVAADFPYDLIGFPEGYPWKCGHAVVPIYRWEGHAVWGITGRIVLHLTEVLCGQS